MRTKRKTLAWKKAWRMRPRALPKVVKDSGAYEPQVGRGTCVIAASAAVDAMRSARSKGNLTRSTRGSARHLREHSTDGDDGMPHNDRASLRDRAHAAEEGRPRAANALRLTAHPKAAAS